MKTLLLSSKIGNEAKDKLLALGYSAIALPEYSRLPSPISDHPDSLIFAHSKSLILDRGYYEENKALLGSACVGREIILSDTPLGGIYPEDARLNAICVGNKLFCRTKSISSAVLRYAEDAHLKIISTKQGYPACSTLKLSEEAVITADEGLASIYEKNGIKVYKIVHGAISLIPYEYGFIGGATIRLDGYVGFFGDYTAHPSRDVIDRALCDTSLVPVILRGGELTDLGGGALL